jgi:acyl-CoA thioesterase YciA
MKNSYVATGCGDDGKGWRIRSIAVESVLAMANCSSPVFSVYSGSVLECSGQTMMRPFEQGKPMSSSNKKPQTGPVVRTRAMPADTNPAGDIFGGWLLSQMDMAGEITAAQQSRSRVVTVAVNAMSFHKPVHVGDVVSCYTHIERIGRTSISIRIEAVASRQITGEQVAVTEGVFVYVALGDNDEPRLMPQKT